MTDADQKSEKARPLLLARKYGQKWKANAWRLGLARRGRERRQKLARSRQSAAEFAHKENDEMKIHSSPSNINLPSSVNRNFINPFFQVKRQSLPSDFRAEMSGALTPPVTSKRKRDANEGSEDLPTQRLKRTSHKRSQTVGNSIMSAPPHRFPRHRLRTSFDVSKLDKDSLLGNTIMKQTRRLAPYTKSDTTHTDYFRLKALGLDPDTPIVPATKKRPRKPEHVHGDKDSTAASIKPSMKKRLSSPIRVGIDGHNKSHAHSPNADPMANQDKDDEFLASIRAIRNTLAESTSWFQTEREVLERSSVGSRSQSQAGDAMISGREIRSETPAQRRLREIRERGPTPSRSEVRMRALGNRAPVPRSFYDSKSWKNERLTNGDNAKGTRKENPVASAEPVVIDDDEEDEQMRTPLPNGKVDYHGAEDSENDTGKDSAQLEGNGIEVFDDQEEEEDDEDGMEEDEADDGLYDYGDEEEEDDEGMEDGEEEYDEDDEDDDEDEEEESATVTTESRFTPLVKRSPLVNDYTDAHGKAGTSVEDAIEL